MSSITLECANLKMWECGLVVLYDWSEDVKWSEDVGQQNLDC